MKSCLAIMLMIAVMLLPLNGMGQSATVHGSGIEMVLVDHDDGHGHSHDDHVDDLLASLAGGDHHHADHNHDKAGTPPSLGHDMPMNAASAYALRHEDGRQDRLYGIDRPPRTSTLA